jgi:hypothetical protein
MKHALAALVICLLGAALFAGDETVTPNIVISKGFKSRNAYLIVCKGFPKEGTDGIQRRETAKEAARMNAQFIARDIFNDTVDPVRNGIAKKFTVNEEYAVVYYEIRRKNLKARLRKGAGKGGK